MIQQSLSQPTPPRLAEVTMPHVYSSAVISDMASFEAIADEWQTLIRKSGLDTLTLDYQWLTTWLKYFPPQQLMIVVVRNEKSELAAALPLMINRTTSGLFQRALRRVQVIGTDPCVYDRAEIAMLPDVPEESILNEIARQLISAKSGWDMIDLRFNPNERQWLSLSRLLASHSAFQAVEDTMPIPWLELPKTEAELDANNRKKRLKQDLRYVKNRLKKEEDETFQLEFQRPSEETTALFHKFFQRHIDYWQSRGFRSDFARYPQLKEFYTEVFNTFQPTAKRLGEVCFSVIKFGDTIISYQIGFSNQGNYLAHLTNYHMEYKRFLPGILHMDMLLVNTLQEEKQFFEFGRGDEEYKKQWTDHKKMLWNLRLYKTPWSVVLWKADLFIKKIARKAAETL